jgi:hypothetical protein
MVILMAMVKAKLSLPNVGGAPKGQTGMGKMTISDDFGRVLKHLADSFKGQKYEPEKWDCEDMSYYGAATVRCAFPGIPVGIALRGDKRAEPGHAQIILWDLGPEPTYIYCDPANGGKIGKPEDFDPDVIVPFPIMKKWGVQVPSPLDSLSPLDGFGVSLDNDYDFDLINAGAIQNELNAKKLEGECKPPENTVARDRYYDPDARFFSQPDRTFYRFAQLKKKYKGAPIGFAFGTAPSKKDGSKIETARIMLWKTSGYYTYWKVGDGNRQKEPNFAPKIVLV